MVFIYQMPTVNAGRGGGSGAGGGGPATGQRTVFRPPWVKDGSEAAAPPPPAGPPWRRQSRTGPPPSEDASGGPSSNSTAPPAKAPDSGEKKVKVIPIARPDDGDKGSEMSRVKSTDSAPPGRGRSTADKEKVIPIARADSKAKEGEEKKAKVIPIARAESREESLPARTRGNSRAAETEVPQRGRFSRQEKQLEPQPERKVSAPGRVDGPVENGLSGRERPQQRPEPVQRQTSQRSSERAPPPPPPPPPMAPPPPPMPTGDVERLDMTPAQRAKLEALRSRPRRRPDWGTMMKEVEQGKKLRHVQCNDRSKPLLPQVKAKGQFVYETEQKNIHNQLLNQIQQGVKLKRVVTNDRSKPVLEGLRKFRRQLTIEEQLQKAEDEAEPEPDELDDIDKVRDDLQSTKQMLALELQNKTQAERENRLLQARIFALEEQLQKERERARNAEEERDKLKESTDCGIPGIGDPLDSLRAQVALAGKTAYEYQQKYQDALKKLDLAKATLEDEQHKNLMLEKRLQAVKEGKGGSGPNVTTSTVSAQTDPVVVVGSEVIPLTKQPSRKEIARAVAAAAAALPQNQQQQKEEEEESEYTEESYSESEEESDTEEMKQERRHAREIKMLASKLKSYREKEGTAKKERRALKEQHERLIKTLNTEKKKYKVLQKEVDKMAKLMKEDDDEGEEEEEEEEEESEEESEESSEESSEEEEETIPVEDPNAPPEKKTFRFEQMIKKHENSLGALKKGNYVLKTNIDRLKDDLEKQKEMYVNLQEDLNSVLAELG